MLFFLLSYANRPLFFLQITKIFSKKKTGITYSFKQSFSLCDMQVYLFETSRKYEFDHSLMSTNIRHAIVTVMARIEGVGAEFYMMFTITFFYWEVIELNDVTIKYSYNCSSGKLLTVT